MTEQEWEECVDAERMLEVLRGKTSDRKRRLFACACCRGIWHFISDDRGRQAVEAGEHFADGAATRAELDAAAQAAGAAHSEASNAADDGLRALSSHGDSRWYAELATKSWATGAAAHAAVEHPCEAAAAGARSAVRAASCACTSDLEALWWGWENLAGAADRGAAETVARIAQSDMVRDIFGSPFRQASLDPSWLTPTVVSLAQAAYDARQLPAGTLDPDRLGVLADALEEGGANEPSILEHLRGPGPHVRGCWAVDIILGKK